MEWELPEPRRVRIKIFGVVAWLSERTKESRRDIEKAFASRNGADSDVLTYALTFKVIEAALSCNVRVFPRFDFIRRILNYKRNRLFGWEYLREHLTESQIDFLVDKINLLDYGERYEEIKKKMKVTKPSPQVKPVKMPATKLSED